MKAKLLLYLLAREACFSECGSSAFYQRYLYLENCVKLIERALNYKFLLGLNLVRSRQFKPRKFRNIFNLQNFGNLDLVGGLSYLTNNNCIMSDIKR